MVDKRSPPNGQNFGQCMLFLTLLEREMARHVIICWFMGSGQCYVSMVKDMEEHSWKIVDNKTWGRGIWIGLSLGKIYWAPCNTHHNVTSQQRILIIKWIVWKVLRVLVSLFSQQSLSFSKKLMKKKEGMVPRVEVMHGFRNMEFHLSSPNLNLSALDSNTESLIGSHSTECLASCLGSWLIILFCFHHGKGRFLFLLE